MADTTPPLDTYSDIEPNTVPPPLKQPVVRSRDGRLIAGVADGLAAAWGWRSWAVRLGFIAATALAGLGIVLYAAGWILIPEEGRPESVAQRMVRSMNIQRAWVGFGLLLAGGLIVGRVANIDGGILVAGALLVSGYALYTGAFTLPPAPVVPPTGDGPPAYVYERAARPARPPRPKSYLGRLTLGAMLVTLGIMGALDATGASRPTTRHYAAAAILVIGVGLLLGFMFGRSRGLIALGLLLLPVVAAAAVADYRFGTTWETVTITPDSLTELSPAYQIGSGDITLDLSRVDFAGESLVLDLDAGIGSIHVHVPPEVAIEATANAIVGDVQVGGLRSSGLGAEVIRSTNGTAGRIVIDADVRIGSITIRRFDSAALEQPRSIGGVGGSTPTAINNRVVQLAGGVGYEEPRSVEEIAGTYEVLDGHLVLDLSRVVEPDAVVPINFVGFGEATVIVPPDARVFATGDIPMADLEGTPDDGVPVWERPGDGITLIINASGPWVSIEEG